MSKKNETTNAGIHIRTWSGSDSARITDLTFAGKRGKKCRVLRFQGWAPYHSADVEANRCADFTRHIGRFITALDPATSFDAACDAIRAEVAKAYAAGVPTRHLGVYNEEIRGIDAPKPALVAGVPGQFAAGADESGVSVADLVDKFNEPRSITHNQSEAEAYRLAAKVWDRVKAAKSYGEATAILRNAGVRLHSYCAVD